MIGDVFSSPWGRYIVRRTEPVLLQSLERAHAYLSEICQGLVHTGEVCTTITIREPAALPIEAQPTTGQLSLFGGYVARAPDPRDEALPTAAASTNRGMDVDQEHQPSLVADHQPPADRRGQLPAHAPQGEVRVLGTDVVDWLADLPPVDAGAHPLTLGGMRPGSVRAADALAWIPCLTQARVTEGEISWAGPHCYFLQPDGRHSWICPDCPPTLNASQDATTAPTQSVRALGLYNPVGAVAIVMGKHVTIDELLAPQLRDDWQPGSGQPGPRATHPVADTPSQGESLAAGNVADPQPTPVNVTAVGATSSHLCYAHLCYGWTPRHRWEWLEEVTERAAIFEHLGGLPRAEADRRAHDLVGPWDDNPQTTLPHISIKGAHYVPDGENYW